jgi:hypothetical protein
VALSRVDAGRALERKDSAFEKCAQLLFHEARHTAAVVCGGVAQEGLELSLDRPVQHALSGRPRSYCELDGACERAARGT